MTKIKTLIAAALLATSGASYAASGSFAFNNNAATFSNPGQLGFGSTVDDTITLTGLAAGTYDFFFTFTGISLTNPVSVVVDTFSPVVSYAGSFSWAYGNVTTNNLPLTIEIDAVTAAAGFAVPPAAYSGSVVAVPVPEPHAIALAIAGLGLVGMMRRRRSEEH